MDKTYSILILPWSGTRVHRFVLSRRLILYLQGGALILLGTGGLAVWNYIQDLELQARLQRERLASLQEQAKNVDALVGTWKELRKKVQSSLPPNHAFSTNGQHAIDNLEKNLGFIRAELEGLIAAVPTGWPSEGRVTSGVGMRASPWTGDPEFHSGIDIPNSVGTPVYAPGDGVVDFVGESNGNGRMVILKHGQGITTHYAHLSEMHVKKGERVRRGQRIASVGNTGRSTSPHLHYEVRINGTPIDPRRNLTTQSSPPS